MKISTNIKLNAPTDSMPADCEFIGYGIIKNDEYLLNFDAELGIQKAWADAPLLACSFESYHQAKTVRDKINRSANETHDSHT